MKLLGLIDTETTDLDPEKGRVIEIAMAIVEPERGQLVEAWSSLIGPAGDNAAAEVNGIDPRLLTHGRALDVVAGKVGATGQLLECFVSHNTDFDRKWLPEHVRESAPWVCSCDEIEWPRKSTGRSLTQLALAHGLGVSHAHRALADVLLLARLFERAVEMGMSIPDAIARGLRPKARFVVAEKGYDEARNKVVKEAGFHWDAAKKEWVRTMAIDDAVKLPFKVRREAA